ncbi:hypothetical protein ACLESO_10610 [Pyxidicoccus sp. 3LG]
MWLHEPMDHGDAVPLPASTGAPRPGQRRLSVALTLFNPGRSPRAFSPQELSLASAAPGPGGSPPAGHLLLPGQYLPVSLDFDVTATPGTVRLEWRRDARSTTLLETRPPPSASPPGSQAPSAWPRGVDALPPGEPRAGEALFHGRFACVACHGDPSKPGDSRIGPSLADFARVGLTRIPGKSAAQYTYESLLDPGAFIAGPCAERERCANPSAMPLYGDVLSLQEMADLVRYVTETRTRE